MMLRIRNMLERLLEAIVIGLVVGMTLIVVVAVIYRKLGQSLVWYDEVASVGLAWITYYGAALAALKRSHIGFDGLLMRLSSPWRLSLTALGETVVIAFFLLVAWTGVTVLEILEGDTLISLTNVPVQLTQSVIPIGAVLFILCELLSLPEQWVRVKAGRQAETEVPPAS